MGILFSCAQASDDDPVVIPGCMDETTAFTDTDQLQAAVSLWVSNTVQAADDYGDISCWDVSQITDMSWMFYEASSFNSDISGWDVSSVTNMSRMFDEASSFSSDISEWDVSSVTDMGFMFYRTSLFNGDMVGQKHLQFIIHNNG